MQDEVRSGPLSSATEPRSGFANLNSGNIALRDGFRRHIERIGADRAHYLRRTIRIDRSVGRKRGMRRRRPHDPCPIEEGTRIAFEKSGSGPAIIIVSGALSDRSLQSDNRFSAQLAEHFTVYAYDWRGRGESTDRLPYAVEREIEDIAALITHAGGQASLYGVSSGAALALHAAARLGPSKVPRLAVYEPPHGQPGFQSLKERVNKLIEGLSIAKLVQLRADEAGACLIVRL